MTNNDHMSLMIVNLMTENNMGYIHRILEEKTSSFQSIKSTISCRLAINMCDFDIYYLGDIFIGGTLEKFDITDNMSLVVKKKKNRRPNDEQILIKVQNPSKSNEVTPYLIDNFLTVRGLRNILHIQYNINIKCVKLWFGKEEMKDDVLISELDFNDIYALTLEIIEEEVCDSRKEISVKVRNSFDDLNRSHILRVPIKEKVIDLRRKIENEVSLPKNDFVLSHLGEILKNENSIDTYNIGDGDEIVISQSLLIRYFTSNNGCAAKVFRYGFERSDTVYDLKTKIWKALNIEKRFIVLSFNGETLEDERLLMDYQIDNDSYLMMVATLAGGCW